MGKNMRAFCLGNGPSRKSIDLESLKSYGTVIGCNAIYRDFTPDILVALDSRIGHEIYRSGYALKNKTYLGYWTPVPKMVAETMLESMGGETNIEWNNAEDVVYHGADGVFTLMVGNNLGMTYITGVVPNDFVENIEPAIGDFAYSTGARAIYLACELGAKEVYIIGYDLFSADGTIDNIYAGTDGYADKLSKVDKGDIYDWIKQHKNTFDSFPNTNFYKVNPNLNEINEWENCKNLKYISHLDLDMLDKK